MTMVLFSQRRRTGREAATRVYAAALSASRRPALYLDLGVADTLQGRFEMVALSLFPVLHRLMHEPGDDPELARLVCECFVDDMDAAFREMGVSDTSVPKRMTTLYRSFAGRIAAYQRALREGDEALVAAVARNVFPDDAEGDCARALSDYLKAAIVAVRAADLARIRHGDVPFPEPLIPAKEGISA